MTEKRSAVVCLLIAMMFAALAVLCGYWHHYIAALVPFVLAIKWTLWAVNYALQESDSDRTRREIAELNTRRDRAARERGQ